ncbi:MAG TPA: hypothetical protein VJV78_38475 [Polyangiales bacterium]|nr:hypothetical protein [Polyangiales bacterium]
MNTVRDHALWMSLIALLIACGPEAPPPRQKLASERLGPEQDEKPPSWAIEAGKSLAKGMQLGAAGRVQPATAVDRAYDASETVPIRRVVYRFAIDVPAAMREAHPPLLPTSSELHIDVAEERLRARFVGTWPVDEGSEVRLRADMPGVYLFDANGGRPLPRNHLASWFLGDEVAQFRRSPLIIRRDPGPSAEGPAELVCALLAEWTGAPREETMRQCSGGALPLGFRFGIWIADLTAIVPMSVPRSQLRADAVGLPRGALNATRVRPLRDPRELAKIAPLQHAKYPDLPPIEGAPGSATLHVVNHGSTRMLIVVSGVPVGWLQPEAAGDFSGFNPGHYRIGWLRPYAQYALLPTPFAIPGELSLGMSPAEPQLDSPRSSDSPEATR